MHVVATMALVAFACALLVPAAASATPTVLVVHLHNGSVFSATFNALQTGTASTSGSTRAVDPTPFIASPSTALPTQQLKQPTGNPVAPVHSAVPTAHQSSAPACCLTVTSGAAMVKAPTAITPAGNILSFVDAGSVTDTDSTRPTTTSTAAIPSRSRDDLTRVLIIIAASSGTLLLVTLIAVGGFVYRRRRRLQEHRAARPYASAGSSDVSRSQHVLKLDTLRLTTGGSEKPGMWTAYDSPSAQFREERSSCSTLQLKYPGFTID